MSTQKLSISLEPELAETIRAAAGADGVSVSSWLAEAAADRIRSYRLGRALDALAEEIGGMDVAEAERLVTEARRRSIVVRPGRRAG